MIVYIMLRTCRIDKLPRNIFLLPQKPITKEAANEVTRLKIAKQAAASSLVLVEVIPAVSKTGFK